MHNRLDTASFRALKESTLTPMITIENYVGGPGPLWGEKPCGTRVASRREIVWDGIKKLNPTSAHTFPHKIHQNTSKIYLVLCLGLLLQLLLSCLCLLLFCFVLSTDPSFIHVVDYGNYMYFFFREVAIEPCDIGQVRANKEEVVMNNVEICRNMDTVTHFKVWLE